MDVIDLSLRSDSELLSRKKRLVILLIKYLMNEGPVDACDKIVFRMNEKLKIFQSRHQIDRKPSKFKFQRP